MLQVMNHIGVCEVLANAGEEDAQSFHWRRAQAGLGAVSETFRLHSA